MNGWLGWLRGKGGRSSVTVAFARRLGGGGRGRGRAVVVEEGFGSEGIFKGRVAIVLGNIEVLTGFIFVSEERTVLRVKDVASFSA